MFIIYCNFQLYLRGLLLVYGSRSLLFWSCLIQIKPPIIYQDVLIMGGMN